MLTEDNFNKCMYLIIFKNYFVCNLKINILCLIKKKNQPTRIYIYYIHLCLWYQIIYFLIKNIMSLKQLLVR